MVWGPIGIPYENEWDYYLGDDQIPNQRAPKLLAEVWYTVYLTSEVKAAERDVAKRFEPNPESKGKNK